MDETESGLGVVFVLEIELSEAAQTNAFIRTAVHPLVIAVAVIRTLEYIRLKNKNKIKFHITKITIRQKYRSTRGCGGYNNTSCIGTTGGRYCGRYIRYVYFEYVLKHGHVSFFVVNIERYNGGLIIRIDILN